MNSINLYIIILILAWTSNPFIKKIITRKIDIDEYNLLLTFFLFIFFLIYYFYYKVVYKTKIDFVDLKKLDIKDYFYIILTVINTLLIFIIVCKLANMTEITNFIPQVYCIIIALSCLIGYLYFNEEMNLYKSIGIIFIILGILLINYKNKKLIQKKIKIIK